MRSPSTPGPEPGYQSPSDNATQPVTANGRPRKSMAPAAGSGVPVQEDNATTLTSPGQVPTPPPVQKVGFTIPWAGMNNGGPQPQVTPGQHSFNPYTGEWVYANGQ